MADVVPLMYGGFLAFFLGLTVFLVRRLGARRGGGPHMLDRALTTLCSMLLGHSPAPLSRRSTFS